MIINLSDKNTIIRKIEDSFKNDTCLLCGQPTTAGWSICAYNYNLLPKLYKYLKDTHPIISPKILLCPNCSDLNQNYFDTHGIYPSDQQIYNKIESKL